jgi:ABC-type branched-subunit amino acid transport system ATPase component
MFLETNDLTKRFGGLTAVDDIDLKIDKGELMAIIGPNGAGKTTLFNLMAGKFPPTKGEIFFEDKEITKLKANERVGLGLVKTFQIPSIFPNLKVFDNIRMAAQAARISGPKYLFSTMATDTDCNEYVIKILERVGLQKFKDENAGGLPHGHKKRLEIGMAVSSEPKLIMLDEVTAGLTAEETKEMSNFILELSSRYTIIMVEHKIEVVLGLAKRIAVMDRGKIIADGNPNEVTANKEVQEVYLKSHRIKDIKDEYLRSHD